MLLWFPLGVVMPVEIEDQVLQRFVTFHLCSLVSALSSASRARMASGWAALPAAAGAAPHRESPRPAPCAWWLRATRR